MDETSVTNTPGGKHSGERPHLPPMARRTRNTLIVTTLLALAWLGFGAWGLWTVLSDRAAVGGGPQRRAAQLEQQVATLTRSDQISRQANVDLQNTLAERDEEIAALRADLAFYERFVGATAQRRGLTVHKLRLQPQSEQAWRFTATLTQNLNRGAVNAGRLQVAVEGTRNGQLQQLGWADLRPAGDPGVAYSFKYFEEVEGDLTLPEGFEPVRVSVRLLPRNGGPVEQSFGWTEATQGTAGGA